MVNSYRCDAETQLYSKGTPICLACDTLVPKNPPAMSDVQLSFPQDITQATQTNRRCAGCVLTIDARDRLGLAAFRLRALCLGQLPIAAEVFRTRLLDRQPSSSLYPVIRQAIQEDPAYSHVKLLRTRKDGKNFRVRVNHTWRFNFRIEGKAYLMEEITHHPK
jgi:hypothetical protein